MSDTENRRLDSWKAIADFLGRDVSTVRRWEAECGLPVHRVSGAKGRSVFAFTGELEIWLNQTTILKRRVSEQAATGSAYPARGFSDSPTTDRIGPRRTLGDGIFPREHPSTYLSKHFRSGMMVAALALLVAAGVLVGWETHRSQGIAEPFQIKTIQVLPFLCEKSDPAGYWGTGLAIGVVRDLAVDQSIEVVPPAPRRAVRLGASERGGRIRGSSGPQASLQGQVRRHDGQLWIQAWLVGKERRIWTVEAAGSEREPVLVRRELSQAILEKLSAPETDLPLPGGAPSRAAREAAPTECQQAWTLMEKRSAGDLRAASVLFSGAIESDPDSAVAYAGLADAHALLGLYNEPPNEASLESRDAAYTAVELNDDLAETHTALAAAKVLYEWDWKGAQREFERAIALNPDYALAHHWDAVLYELPLGHYSEAIRQLRVAERLAPESSIVPTDLAWAYQLTGQAKRAEGLYQWVLRRDSDFLPAHYRLLQLYAQEREYQKAAREFIADRNPHSSFTPDLRQAVTMRRNLDGSEYFRLLAKELDNLTHPPAGGRVNPYGIASTFCLLGQQSAALDWLERAAAEHDPGLIYLGVDPVWKPIRSDPRFQSLEATVGLRTNDSVLMAHRQ